MGVAGDEQPHAGEAEHFCTRLRSAAVPGAQLMRSSNVAGGAVALRGRYFSSRAPRGGRPALRRRTTGAPFLVLRDKHRAPHLLSLGFAVSRLRSPRGGPRSRHTLGSGRVYVRHPAQQMSSALLTALSAFKGLGTNDGPLAVLAEAMLDANVMGSLQTLLYAVTKHATFRTLSVGRHHCDSSEFCIA